MVSVARSACHTSAVMARQHASRTLDVMAGHSCPKDGVASVRLCPAIHVFLRAQT
jgi:hypothetical protein